MKVSLILISIFGSALAQNVSSSSSTNVNSTSSTSNGDVIDSIIGQITSFAGSVGSDITSLGGDVTSVAGSLATDATSVFGSLATDATSVFGQATSAVSNSGAVHVHHLGGLKWVTMALGGTVIGAFMVFH